MTLFCHFFNTIKYEENINDILRERAKKIQL